MNDESHPQDELPSYEKHVPAAAQPGARPYYACITLNGSDKLRMISFTTPTIQLVRDAIFSSWPRGIQREGGYHGAYEFKLYGYPWRGQGMDAVQSRLLMLAILSSMFHAGWELITSTDISKNSADKDTLFFKSVPAPPPCSFFAISFNEGDKIRTISAHPDQISVVRTVLGTRIQREEWKLLDVAYQFKLLGHPWYRDGADSVAIRVTLLNLLTTLAASGWELHASIDISANPGGEGTEGMDTDTWFFRKLNG